MTTATKLSFGFGALIFLLVVSNVAIIVPLQAVDSEIRTMSEVGRPRRAATQSIEAGVLSFALAVRTYAQTNDPAHQKEAEDAIFEVEAHHADYVRMAETENDDPETKNLGRQILKKLR